MEATQLCDFATHADSYLILDVLQTSIKSFLSSWLSKAPVPAPPSDLEEIPLVSITPVFRFFAPQPIVITFSASARGEYFPGIHFPGIH
jgi:hypothetical protein